MKKQLTKTGILFYVGGSIYYFIEFIWKTFITFGVCHWSMFLLGGLCFLLIGAINEYIPWEISIIKQGAIGAIIVTVLELIFGVILNIWLKLEIWNYASLPLNILGQICLPFSVIWFFLSIIAIVVDDYLRWWWFGEAKPHYHLRDSVCY